MLPPRVSPPGVRPGLGVDDAGGGELEVAGGVVRVLVVLGVAGGEVLVVLDEDGGVLVEVDVLVDDELEELEEVDEEELEEELEEVDVDDELEEVDEDEVDEGSRVEVDGSLVEVGSGGGSWVVVIGAGAFEGELVCGRYCTSPGGGSFSIDFPSRAPIMKSVQIRAGTVPPVISPYSPRSTSWFFFTNDPSPLYMPTAVDSWPGVNPSNHAA